MQAQAQYNIGFQPGGSITPIVETFTGQTVDLITPDPDTINITDIVISLARNNRYNGHSNRKWSVASHSMLCVDFARQFFASDATDWMCMHILLHDAHEAYTGDIVAPVKYIPAIREVIANIEQALQHAIEQAFNIGTPTQSEHAFIKLIDDHVLAIEAHHLMHSKGRNWNLRPIFKDALDLFDMPNSEDQVCRHFTYRFEKLLSRIEFDRRTGATAI